MVGIGGLLLQAGLAQASTGPWLLGAGDESVYVGLDAQRFGTLALSSGSYADDVVTVDDGLTSLGGKIIGTFGLTRRVELELEFPVVYTFANGQGAVCGSLGLGACEPSAGVGVLVARSKFLVVDELAGAPLTLSLGLDLRFGQPTFDMRARITASGQGTFDLEPRVGLGRIGSLRQGKGYWSLFVDGGFRYRLPLDQAFGPDGVPAPGYEITANLENLWSPVPMVSFGPAVSLLTRPVGLDVEQVLADPALLGDPDRFSGINLTVLDAGGKLILRNGRNITFAAAVFYTLYARNNPSDVLKVSVGVGFRDLFRKRGT